MSKTKNIVRDLDGKEGLKFKVTMQNTPLLKPVLFCTFSPDALWASTSEKMCRHDLLAKINSNALKISKISDADIYVSVVFRGEECNPEDPRLHAHWIIYSSTEIDPEVAKSCFPYRWKHPKATKDPKGNTLEELYFIHGKLLEDGTDTSIDQASKIAKSISKLEPQYVPSGRLDFQRYDPERNGIIYAYKYHFPISNNRGVFFSRGRSERRERKYKRFYQHIKNTFQEYGITEIV